MGTNIKVNDEVRVTVGEYKGLEGTVVKIVEGWGVSYRVKATNKGGWMWTIGSQLVFDASRLEQVTRRVEGERIAAKDVRVGDVIKLEYKTDAYGQDVTYVATISEIGTDSNGEVRLYSKNKSRGLYYVSTWTDATTVLVKEGPDPKAELIEKLKKSPSEQIITFGKTSTKTARKRNYLDYSVWDVFALDEKAVKYTPEELAKILPKDAVFLTAAK